MTWFYPGGLTDTDFADGETTSGWQPQNFLYGAHIVVASAMKATMMGVKTNSAAGASLGLKYGLYTSAGTLLAQSTGTVVSATFSWRDSGAIDVDLSAGTYYVLISGETSAVQYQWDEAGDGSFATEAYADAMENETISAGAEAGKLYGVRLNLEASGGGGSSLSARKSLLGVGV